MISSNWLGLFHATLPETALEVTALLVLLVDIAFLRKSAHWLRFRAAALISVIGIVVAGFAVLCLQPVGAIDGGMVAVFPIGKLVELGLLAIVALCLLMSLDEDFTDHVGEFVALMLFATIGGMMMVTTQNLLMIFLALELLSLSLYILTAFNKKSVQSSEAALKYFLFGGMSAAMLLFGFSLLYGLSGTLDVTAMDLTTMTPLVGLAVVMVLIGFAFKVAAAPLHWWAPDVYQGAPAPAAMFIASGSKLASFFLFLVVLDALGTAIDGVLVPAMVVLAVVSMLWGNLAALAQSNVRRLLAYSAVAHTGYMLLAFLASGDKVAPALVFYVLTYSVAVIGAFGITAIVEREMGGSELKNFAGLSKRSPLLAFCLLIFVLSMAGIPPLAGFIAKFNLFAVFWQAQPELWWLVALAIAMSAVSLFYYLQILKQAYVVEAQAEEITAVPASLLTKFVLLLSAAGVIALGCFPQVLLGVLENSMRHF